MKSHKFINCLLLLMIRLVAKESRANENNCGIKCSFVLFIDKRHISQVIHFNEFPRKHGIKSLNALAFCCLAGLESVV